MALQLVLIDDSDRDWRISEHTKQVGRDGIAAARAALAAGRRRSALAEAGLTNVTRHAA